jgi:uncharacterized protein (DUF1015 family)
VTDRIFSGDKRMAERSRIQPFRALVYSASSGDLASLVAPPYDLIDRHLQDELYARSPYNIVRLELNRDADRYGSSAATLRQWCQDSVLEKTPVPAIYHYTQSFQVERRSLIREGLMVRLRLEEFAPGRILPHERTFAAPKADRLRLLQATEVNTSSIFGLYPATPELSELLRRVRERAPLMRVRDYLDIVNEIRAITDPSEISLIQRALDNAGILIADGHHRYSTALTYRAMRRQAEGDPSGLKPYDYTFITLVADHDPGLLILPTHRLVRQLDAEAVQNFFSHAHRFFTIEAITDPDTLLARLRQGGAGVLGASLRGQGHLSLLRLKDPGAMATAAPAMPGELRDLDVSRLHTLVFQRLLAIDEAAVHNAANIEYLVDARAALAAVRNGQAAGAFLMNPPSVDDLKRVSGSGQTMPEKSTYFYPKLLTGLIINPLVD